eukprot:1555188-Rhodomonas_salina.2
MTSDSGEALLNSLREEMDRSMNLKEQIMRQELKIEQLEQRNASLDRCETLSEEERVGGGSHSKGGWRRGSERERKGVKKMLRGSGRGSRLHRQRHTLSASERASELEQKRETEAGERGSKRERERERRAEA